MKWDKIMTVAQPIDPEILPFASEFAAQMSEPGLSVHESRARYAELLTQQGDPETPVATKDMEIPTRHGSVGARLYTPKDPRPALLVYMHGGGFVVGGLDSLEVPLHALSHDAGVSVLSLDYALAPENMYPIALEQCQDALLWVEQNRKELGGTRHLAVGGDSAGGNIAAMLAHWARDNNAAQLDWQVLINPVLDFPAVDAAGTESHGLYGDSPMLNTEAMKGFNQLYFKDEKAKIGASPLLSDDLSGLPPAFIAAAECDALRDDSIAYAKKLADHGTPADLTVYEGMTHNFLVLTHASRTSRKFLSDLIEATTAWART
ncbi:alpha/beta hydrolase [Citricoccus alkalitolerans]|uniref:Alpha/beta hydrolase n=1 Tax=Citricoccus alkalitolerans TaxID=246603 RepID=A0ABV8XYB7_9MICC